MQCAPSITLYVDPSFTLSVIESISISYQQLIWKIKLNTVLYIYMIYIMSILPVYHSIGWLALQVRMVVFHTRLPTTSTCLHLLLVASWWSFVTTAKKIPLCYYFLMSLLLKVWVWSCHCTPALRSTSKQKRAKRKECHALMAVESLLSDIMITLITARHIAPSRWMCNTLLGIFIQGYSIWRF